MFYYTQIEKKINIYLHAFRILALILVLKRHISAWGGNGHPRFASV
jgi:hypothetical protein